MSAGMLSRSTLGMTAGMRYPDYLGLVSSRAMLDRPEHMQGIGSACGRELVAGARPRAH